MSAPRVIITGAKSAQPASRREIVELFSSQKPEDKAQVDLFVQALRSLQHRDPNDPTSYFQVAGVHGKPYVMYDPKPNDEQKEADSTWGGYCVHGDTLFPTWHRPYLAAFEQFIQAEAIVIAATYNNQVYTQAAQNLRLPFWDWASPQSAQVGLPQFLKDDNITVNTPSGPQQIPNPLVRYEFQTIPSDFSGGFERYKTTIRRPDADAQIKNSASALQQGVRNIFDVQKWLDFSNHRTATGTTNNGISSHTSLENLHDSLHGLIGGNGHMGNPDYAAFDPVFFLHHCNVDRLLALWQAAFPDVYVQPYAEEGGTFTVRDGEVETESSPLTPWRKSETEFWNSVECRDVKALNYTYPELEWKLEPTQLRAQMIAQYGGKNLVRQFVNTNVAPPQQPSGVAQASSASSSASSGPPPKTGYTATPTHAPTHPAPAGYTSTPTHPAPTGYTSTPTHPAPTGYTSTPTHPAPTGYTHNTPAHNPTGYSAPGGSYTRVENHHLKEFREWFTLIDVRKNVHGGPFTIHVFLGDVPADHNLWPMAPSHCGVVNIFARNDDTNCAKCKKDTEVIVGGTVSLTEVMLARGCKLDIASGTAFLQKELKLRVFKYDTNEVIDALTIPTLTLRVQTASVKLDQIVDDKIKDVGNGRVSHRVPSRYGWTHVAALDKN